MKKLKTLIQEKRIEMFGQYTIEHAMRLDIELNQIKNLGMENTFLVCYHLTQLVKKNKGLIGPSPALSSSSLVLYLLGISMVNPMEHGLLFEHFSPIKHKSTVTIGMEVDMDSLTQIRNQLTDSGFLFDNMHIKDSTFCNVLELSIDDNTIQLSGSKVLTELSWRKNIDFSSLSLNDMSIFQKLSDPKQIISMRVLKSDFFVGYTMEQHKFLNEYAPKSIEDLAQVFVYLKPWCKYDLDSILKRRKGVSDLTMFQKKFFMETNGIYTFPEQVSSMLQRHLSFSKHQTQSYQKAVRKKVNELYNACEELFFENARKDDYDLIDLEQIWYNMTHYNSSMTDKTMVIGEAILLYWWVYAMSHKQSIHS